MMSSNPWFNHPPMGAIGATGATSYGATGATGATEYSYSELCLHAKLLEDREAMMSAAEAVNNSRKVGATGATYNGLLAAQQQMMSGLTPPPFDQRKAVSPSVYPYSALSPQAKQSEDREAEIERIARLMASTKVHGDDMLDLLVVGPHFNFMRLPDGCYVIPQNDDYSVMPYWRTFYRAAEAVYEDRRK